MQIVLRKECSCCCKSTDPMIAQTSRLAFNENFSLRQFKYCEKSELDFSSFSSSLCFSLIFQQFFLFYSLRSMASSISSSHIMMKFLGNWVKCAYTQKHCFFIFLFPFFIKCIFLCNSLFLNLHDMSVNSYDIFQLNYSTTTRNVFY